jgi:Type II secretion system (T2SS), protein M subtype b
VKREAIVLALRRALTDLGASGLAAGLLLAAVMLFFALVVKPMQGKNESLAAAVQGQARSNAPSASGAAGKLASVYRFLDKEEATTDWLAKLYAIAKATGVDMKTANYRTQKAGSRVERYEITLPVSGSYGQIRDFMKRSLEEIPVLSLDQVTLRRENRTDGVLHAELRMTLHLLKK